MSTFFMMQLNRATRPNQPSGWYMDVANKRWTKNYEVDEGFIQLKVVPDEKDHTFRWQALTKTGTGPYLVDAMKRCEEAFAGVE